MQLIRGLVNLPNRINACVASIGNFDGVHRGHQAVIAQLLKKRQALALPAVIMTFEPQPQEYFRPDDAPGRLMRLRDKVEVLRPFGLDYLVCLHFNAELAAMEAEAFVHRILVEGVGARYLVVGDDFRFGSQRRGDCALLRQLGKQFKFEVDDLHTIAQGKERVSSTAIRLALSKGRLDQARELLGREFSIRGRVAQGDKRGRSWGFPTINLRLRRKALPLRGVYAVSVRGLAHDDLPGVANVGVRPTVDGTNALLEVHLLDFDADVYGRRVEIVFLKRLRDEQKFESFDALKAQIRRDVQTVRQYFDSE